MSEKRSNLTFGELQAASLARSNTTFHPGGIVEWTPSDWSNAMAGEAGEACNITKKMLRIAPTPEHAMHCGAIKLRSYKLLQAKLAKELADVVCYAVLAAERNGIELGEAIRDKFNQVSLEKGSEIFLTDEELTKAIDVGDSFGTNTNLPPIGTGSYAIEKEAPSHQTVGDKVSAVIIRQGERGTSHTVTRIASTGSLRTPYLVFGEPITARDEAAKLRSAGVPCSAVTGTLVLRDIQFLDGEPYGTYYPEGSYTLPVVVPMPKGSPGMLYALELWTYASCTRKEFPSWQATLIGIAESMYGNTNPAAMTGVNKMIGDGIGPNGAPGTAWDGKRAIFYGPGRTLQVQRIKT